MTNHQEKINRILRNSPEVELANNQNPPEGSKDIKIKRMNDGSDKSDLEVSVKKPETNHFSPSAPLVRGTANIIQGQVEESGNDLGARTTTGTPTITGITVQYVKPDPTRKLQGITLYVNIQLSSDADDSGLKLTAELKKHDRIRTLKEYECDSEEFTKIYLETRDAIKSLKPELRQNLCMGRMHTRRGRGEWYPDIMAVATLDEHKIVKHVIMYVGTQEFEFEMTADILSPSQTPWALTGGVWGQLRRGQRQVYTIFNGPRSKF